MSIDTLIGIVGAVLFITGIAVYLKSKKDRIKLISFVTVVIGTILVAVSIVGLPT